jgi:HB1, ASXL, restriction endonuclease HTH domain
MNQDFWKIFHLRIKALLRLAFDMFLSIGGLLLFYSNSIMKSIPPSIRKIVPILEEFPTGIHYKNLTILLLERNIIVSKGKTPWLTINSLLNTHIKKYKEQSRIIKHTTLSGRFLTNTLA